LGDLPDFPKGAAAAAIALPTAVGEEGVEESFHVGRRGCRYCPRWLSVREGNIKIC
jgi:hypothetical protein